MPISRLKDCTPALTHAARELYEVSFPPSERSDFDAIVQADQLGEHEVLVLSDDGAATALCIASRLSWPALFIEYFAVAPHRRGAGVGSDFLSSCLAMLLSGSDRGAVLEIERVDAAPEDIYRPVRRAFWEKNGAEVLLDRFVVPRLDGHDGTLEMTLMWIPRGDEARPDARALAREVLVEGYGLLAVDAEALLRAVDS